MKKTYIKPENTVVSINLETLIAESPGQTQMFNPDKKALVIEGSANMEGRETITSRDAWEEW